MPDNLIRASAVAAYLGVSRQSVFRWAKQDKLPCYRLGESTIRFLLSEVEEWVDSCARGSGAAGIAQPTAAPQENRMID